MKTIEKCNEAHVRLRKGNIISERMFEQGQIAVGEGVFLGNYISDSILSFVGIIFGCLLMEFEDFLKLNLELNNIILICTKASNH